MKKILFIMKKIAFIMIVIGSFALVACGSKDEGNNTPGDTTNSNETGNEDNNEKMWIRKQTIQRIPARI